jgi:hypothetical protein
MILSYENAFGCVTPTMLLVQGRGMKIQWPDSLPPGFLGQMNSRDRMTRDVFVNYLSHFSV